MDANIHEKILSKAADKEMELTLQDITNAVVALKMSKRDQVMLIGDHGNLNRQGPTKEVRTKAGASY